MESTLKSSSGHASTVMRVENAIKEVFATDVTLLKIFQVLKVKYAIENNARPQHKIQRLNGKFRKKW